MFRDTIVLKAIFLTAYFGFFRLSNLVSHEIGGFDYTRHFTGVTFSSKTLQTRDQVKLITLPKLGASTLCLYKALKAVYRLYEPAANEPLFQSMPGKRFQAMADATVRKNLVIIV